MNNAFQLLLISVMLMCASSISVAQNLPNYNASKGVGIDGYDPVSYHTDKPKKGMSSIKTVYGGITFYFVSNANLQLFIKSPEKYIPVYGGWCAYAMGNTGELVEVDPETYKIIDGKLYLFYNRFFTNTRTEWNKNEATLKRQADNNWNKLNK